MARRTRRPTGFELLLERIASCDRVIAIAAAHGDEVPAIATRRAELAVELDLRLGPVVCADCDQPTNRCCCCRSVVPDLGWVGA